MYRVGSIFHKRDKARYSHRGESKLYKRGNARDRHRSVSRFSKEDEVRDKYRGCVNLIRKLMLETGREWILCVVRKKML